MMATGEEPTVPLVFGLSRLVDTYMYAEDLLEAFSGVQDQIMERHIHGVSSLADEHGILQLTDESLETAARSQFAELLQQAAEQKARAYSEWILNQGLVSFCTVFDAFLHGLVDAIVQTRVEILYASAGAKNIELTEIVEHGSIEAITAHFREKELKRFGFQDIQDRFDYLDSRLGLNIDETFRFGRFTPEAQEALADWDVERIAAVYDKRHRIVHRDERPVQSLEELREMHDVLSKIMIDLAFQAKVRHSVEIDLLQPIARLRTLLNIESSQ